MAAESPDEEFIQQYFTYRLQGVGRFVVVENVPARVSLRTGERFFSPDTVERLHKLCGNKRFPCVLSKLPSFNIPLPSPEQFGHSMRSGSATRRR